MSARANPVVGGLQRLKMPTTTEPNRVRQRGQSRPPPSEEDVREHRGDDDGLSVPQPGKQRTAHSSGTIAERLARLERLEDAREFRLNAFMKAMRAEVAEAKASMKCATCKTAMTPKKTPPARPSRTTATPKTPAGSRQKRGAASSRSSALTPHQRAVSMARKDWTGHRVQMLASVTDHEQDTTNVRHQRPATNEITPENNAGTTRRTTHSQGVLTTNVSTASEVSRKRHATDDATAAPRRILLPGNGVDYTPPIKQLHRCRSSRPHALGCQLCGNFGHTEKASLCKWLMDAIVVLKDRRKWHHYEPRRHIATCKICDGDHDLEECALFGELSRDATLIAKEREKVRMAKGEYEGE